MLGIDVGSYAIKLAVAKGGGKKPLVSKILYEVIPFEVREKDDAQAKKQIIESMIKRAGKNESSVALSIRTSSAILKTIDLPSGLSDADLEGEIQMELINLIPFPLDQVYVDFVSLGPKKGSSDMQEVLVAVTRKAIVDSAASIVTAKSIKEKVVDIEVSAVSLLIETIKGKNYQDIYAVIDIGYNLTNFYVVAKDGLLFSREQQIGGQQLTESISDSMSVSMEDAETTKLNAIGTVPDEVIDAYIESLVEQTALALELYQSANEREIKGIYLTGGGSSLQAVIPALQKGLNHQSMEYLPICDSVKINDNTDGVLVNTLSSVSIGLALRS